MQSRAALTSLARRGALADSSISWGAVTMVNFPKELKTYCKFCKNHQKWKVHAPSPHSLYPPPSSGQRTQRLALATNLAEQLGSRAS